LSCVSRGAGSAPLRFGATSFGLDGLLAANVAADFVDLGGQVLLDDLTPHRPAFAIFVGTGIEALQLFPARPNEVIEPEQLDFEFGRLLLLTFNLRSHVEVS